MVAFYFPTDVTVWRNQGQRTALQYICLSSVCPFRLLQLGQPVRTVQRVLVKFLFSRFFVVITGFPFLFSFIVLDMFVVITITGLSSSIIAFSLLTVDGFDMTSAA